LPPTRPPGLYEELVTRRLEAALDEIRGEGWRDEITSLDPAEAPGVLARFVHDLVEPVARHLPAHANCDENWRIRCATAIRAANYRAGLRVLTTTY